MVRTSRTWTLVLTAVVLLTLALSACAPAATPAPAPKAEAPKPAAAAPKAEAPKPAAAAPKTEAPKPAAEAPKAEAPKPAPAADTSEWEKVLAAAKKEGKVVVAGPPGTTFRDAMKVFEKKYPEIKLEWQTFTPAPFVARFYQERNAGQFLWDVYITGPTSFDITAKKAGDLLPVRPALLLPEVLDEKAWHGGFKGAFLDNEMQYIFGFMGEENAAVMVNRDVVSKDSLSTIKGLADPKWKGKIAMQDPRIDGGGSARIAHWRGALGEDFARAFLKQEPVLSDDRRQLAEWVVRGQYPIGVFDSQFLVEFQKEGIGKNVVPLGTKQDPGAYRMGTSWGGVRLISKPPDPNAAKVFVNWLLTKEGQTAWVENTQRASRRMDVPRIEGLSPEAGVDYFDIDRESRVTLRDEAIKLAKEVLK